MHFGEHATIDGYGGDYEKLDNKDLVLNCLNDLPTKLDMEKLSKPEVYHAPGNDKKDPGGWSGFVVIAESHISIHTFSSQKISDCRCLYLQKRDGCGINQRLFQTTLQSPRIRNEFYKKGIEVFDNNRKPWIKNRRYYYSYFSSLWPSLL